MAVNTIRQAEELTFEHYTKRQHYEVSRSGLHSRAEKVKASDKFKNHHGVCEKMPYPGYAVVSMVNNNPGNEKLFEQLKRLQAELKYHLGNSNNLYGLPAHSFHQTVANTLSSYRYEKHIKQTGIEREYPTIIQRAFEQIMLSDVLSEPIEMKMIGLSIFGAAIGILGIFENETNFKRIIDFRNSFYAVPELNNLDIRRTRPFIGHITLAYLDGAFGPKERQLLAEVCDQLNREHFNSQSQWFFKISKTELRSYEDLSTFHARPHYPEYSFINPDSDVT